MDAQQGVPPRGAPGAPHLVLERGAPGVGPGPAEEQVFAIPEGETSIGRSSTCDLRLADSSISRNHCRLVRKGVEVRVFDTQSRNRTRVGKLSAHGKLLLDGDVIRIGRLKALFRDGSSKNTSAPAAPVDEPRTVSAARLVTPEAIVCGTTGPGSRASAPVARVASLVPPLAGASRHNTMAPWTSQRSGRLLLGVALLAISAVCGLCLGAVLLEGRSNDAGAELKARLESLERYVLLQGNLLAGLQSRLGGEHATISPALQERIYASLQSELESSQFAALKRRIDDLIAETRSVSRAAARDPAEPAEGVRVVHLEDFDLPPPAEPASVTGERGAAGAPSSSSGTSTVSEGATEVVAAPAPKRERRNLSSRDIRALVESLRTVVSEYATPGFGPAQLEPDLATLTSGLGVEPAKGLFEVYGYATHLSEKIATDLTYLRRRNAALLRKARSLGNPPEGSSSKKPRSWTGGQYEQDQRTIELSEKKIEILEKHREHLGAFAGRLRAAFADFADVEAATEYIATRFTREKDAPLRYALADALGAARARHAVPELARELDDVDPTLRTKVHDALTAIAGTDLGTAPKEWNEWYARHQ